DCQPAAAAGRGRAALTDRRRHAEFGARRDEGGADLLGNSATNPPEGGAGRAGSFGSQGGARRRTGGSRYAAGGTRRAACRAATGGGGTRQPERRTGHGGRAP